jgi:hypothetical protein
MSFNVMSEDELLVAVLCTGLTIQHHGRDADPPAPEPRRSHCSETNKGQDESRVCNHLTAAIYTDGLEKGRLVKVCADRARKVHFREQQAQEKQRLKWKAEKTAANRKAKQTISTSLSPIRRLGIANMPSLVVALPR